MQANIRANLGGGEAGGVSDVRMVDGGSLSECLVNVLTVLEPLQP